jgi:bifunctional oligoribonuclease and PAP phosphatase NrnA
MLKNSFADFKKLIKSSNNIAIVSHFNPDGDALGSSLGLYHYLIQLNKKVTVIMPNNYPDFLHWLPGNSKVLTFQNNEAKVTKLLNTADCIFTLDFNSYKRVEKQLSEVLEKTTAPKVLIDHHQQPDKYAKLYLHDVKACSTCELVYDLIIGLGGKNLIDKKIAACLYTGLMTDTGSFRYPSVTAKTHAIIAHLLDTGILPSKIHSAVYDTYSAERLKLVGYMLSEKMKVMPNFPVAFFGITHSELLKFNHQKGDTEGLVNYPFAINGIKVCAFFSEAPEGYIKISFRSKDKIDVNAFARQHFNGGGHVNAAGGKSTDSLIDTIKKFETLAPTLFK